MMTALRRSTLLAPLKPLIRRLAGRSPNLFGIDYWERRALEYGARSVLNINHSPEEADEVTQMQVRAIFPALQSQLNGTERVALDYGCGPGRFTAQLAQTIGGQATGIDPIKTLIDLAPKSPNVSFKVAPGGKIPLADSSVDVVFVCLVMGAVPDRSVPLTVREVFRVLKPGGLLFLVENTTDGKVNGPTWIFRSVVDYQRMFRFARLAHLRDYWDLGERISIMAGRVIES